eukprot:TRINITY_DN3403_c0_g1_i1.p1 TRINITY_DN3403_c0_g1~~TRINITY_DN3403_c0_g1_i1.p1  ORF type:complete len:202 (-),score=46.62 TRINITY_DN3403_c0_g1_i1:14-619(-)
MASSAAGYLFATTYRDWGDFSVEHLITLIGLLSLLLLLYSVVRNKRTMALETARGAIFQPQSMLSGKTLPNRIQSVIQTEIEKETAIVNTLVPVSAGMGDPGWGKVKNVDSYVHFATSIAKSFCVLDEVVSVARPGLRLANFRTVREYVNSLTSEFPQIPPNVADHYAQSYEQARFGNMRFNQKEYDEFMKTMQTIIENIQ